MNEDVRFASDSCRLLSTRPLLWIESFRNGDPLSVKGNILPFHSFATCTLHPEDSRCDYECHGSIYRAYSGWIFFPYHFLHFASLCEPKKKSSHCVVAGEENATELDLTLRRLSYLVSGDEIDLEPNQQMRRFRATNQGSGNTISTF